ncbi:MAG: hypothetical protein HeimC2_38420 [Candidatus Heimdallarchaeota archaeon LC_2]|nr:MAG: hypothetical protein HeimC2_38420 [Candidatus Heimdallarchaeota archaeon LC_2]
MGTTVGLEYSISESNRWNRIANRPATLIFLVLATIVIGTYYYYNMDYNLVLFLFYLFSPIIPAMILEQKWQKAVDENLESASVLFEVIKKHRITFLMAGFVLSFIQIIVGLFLKYMVFRTEIIPDDLNQTFKITYEVDLVGTIFYIITIIFMAIYVTASFYRVRAEDHTTGNRYNYLSSPAQITLLLSYSFVGVNLDFAILWFTQSLNANNAIDL